MVHILSCGTSRHRSDVSPIRAADPAVHLRGLLEIGDDHPLRAVAAVRDPFEHIDERLDAVVASGAMSIADWYLTTGMVAGSARDVQEGRAAGAGLRCFLPTLGVLIFDDQHLDLFKLDIALLDLLARIPAARAAVAAAIPPGQNHFAGQMGEVALTSDEAMARFELWRSTREARGASIPGIEHVRLVPNHPGSD